MLARWITWNETVDDYVGSIFCYFDSKLKVGFKTVSTQSLGLLRVYSEYNQGVRVRVRVRVRFGLGLGFGVRVRVRVRVWVRVRVRVRFGG